MKLHEFQNILFQLAATYHISYCFDDKKGQRFLISITMSPDYTIDPEDEEILLKKGFIRRMHLKNQSTDELREKQIFGKASYSFREYTYTSPIITKQ